MNKDVSKFVKNETEMVRLSEKTKSIAVGEIAQLRF